jgi:2-phospho-L-lactate guanylyltransferase
MGIWVVIPVKPLKDVKRRLAGVLAADERARLIEQFLGHELDVLRRAAAGYGVVMRALVVTSDPAVAALAGQCGAEVLMEDEADGLNVAVARGVGYAGARGANGVLVLPADLPFLTPEDIGLLLQTVPSERNGYSSGKLSGVEKSERGQRPLMAICADKAGTGTNALLLAPPVGFTFHYGPDSFRLHTAEAARRGLVCQIVFAPGLSFDLDTEEEWRLYLERLEIERLGD